MSRTAKVTGFLGDGDYPFLLDVPRVMELQELTDCGLTVTLDRVVQLRLYDLQQVLRLGLIGGGMDPERAHRHVQRHVVPGYLTACMDVAVKVVSAAAQGVAEEDLGEPKGEPVTSRPRSPAARSGGPSSSATPKPRASATGTSKAAPSGKRQRASRAGSGSTAPSPNTP